MQKLISFIISICSVAYVYAGSGNFSHYTLKNGLEVLILPEHRAPLAWFQIWYKVGSGDEINGKTGLSHALEHMMFKGTEKYPNGAIWQIVSANGGAQNAFTSRDYTCYWQMFPSDKIELSFDIESDRMQNLIIHKSSLEKEKQVILEERRMRTEDNPRGLMYEQYMAAINLATNYQNPVIGWKRDIQNLQVADLQDWHDLWYKPNNAIIVVAGDVEVQNVLALANKYFANIPLHAIQKTPALSPVPQLGKKVLNVETHAKVPSVTFGYIVPSLKTATDPKEVYALTLLSQVLAGSDSALLIQDLVRNKQIAANISNYYSPFAKHDTDYTFSAIPSENSTVATVEKKVLHYLETLKTTLIPDNDLNRAKAQIYASEIYTKESIKEDSLNMGGLYSIGLTRDDYTQFMKGLQDVTAGDIKAVAIKYFIPNQATFAYLQKSRT